MAVTAAPTPRPSACRALVPYAHHASRAGALEAAQVHDLVVTPHPLTLQGQTITRAARMRPGESLAGLLARHGVDLRQPGWVVRVGGMEVPAALCSRTRVRPGMLIEAHRVPGKNVIRLVALVVLAYYTMGAGLGPGGLGGALGLTGLPAYLVNVGAFMLGSMVINKVLPPPGQGSYGGAQPGATYSLQGARNGARQFGPLGLLFGQVRVAPDFAALPYTWFEGDDQIQYVQLHAGLNVHTVEALQIGETAIESYSDVTVSRTGFSSGNTAMPAWESVDSVAGGLLDAPTAPGAYVERTSSPNTIMLAVDLVGQLQYVNSKGRPERFTCNVDIEIKLLPSGAWQPFVGSSATVQLANSTTKPLRRTITRGVTAGQYAVRMRKVTANETRAQAANLIEWSALKSYQNDFGTAVARQVVGIRIRASGQLNGTLDQVTWLATSTPCPVWNGSAWVTQTTSNPGALILQFARGAFAPDGRLLWGYGKPDSQIDIEGLKAFMVHCTAQGYRFDHWFTEAVNRRDVLDAIAAAGLASISRHTGKLGVVYMAAGQPIEAVVNMGNIKRGSFRVDYGTRTTAEEIEVSSPERTNAWRPASLRVLAPGVTVPRETARISPAGITTQAGRLLAARSLMAQNIYGRKAVSWEMDLEHLTVRRWSVVALSHDLTQWGHGGRLHSLTDTAGTITIELDAEVPAGSTPHVGLRLPGETTYRVFAVVPFTGTVHTLTLATSWPVGVSQPGASADNPAMDTLWVYDFKATPGQRLRITDIAPTPNLSGARITAVPEPDEFWAFMSSGTYTAPAGTSTVRQVQLSDLKVTQERVPLSYDVVTELSITFTADGPYDHAQVWGAADDDPLQLLGQTRTTRFTGWRVPNIAPVRVEVRPFDALGRPGAVLAGDYDVMGKSIPPSDVQGFGVEVIPTGLRFFCQPCPDFDYGLTEMHDEAVWNDATKPVTQEKASRWEVSWPAPGLHTYLAKHRDTDGAYSQAAAMLQLTVNADNTISDVSTLWLTTSGAAAVWSTTADAATTWRTGLPLTTNVGTGQMAPESATEVREVVSLNTDTRVYGFGSVLDCGLKFSMPRACKAIVRAEFDASGESFTPTQLARVVLAPLSAWDLTYVVGSDYSRASLVDVDAAQLGEKAKLATTRARFSISRSFSVEPGVEYLAGLLCSSSALLSDDITLYDATLVTVELIKI